MEVISDKYPRLETLDISTICHNPLNEDGEKKPSDREEVLLDKNIFLCKDTCVLEDMSATRNTEHREDSDAAIIKALTCSGAVKQLIVKNGDGNSSGIRSDLLTGNSSSFFTNVDYKRLTVENTVVIHQGCTASCNMNCLLSPYYSDNSRYSRAINQAYFFFDGKNKEMCSGTDGHVATHLTRSHYPKSLTRRERFRRNTSEEHAHLIQRHLYVVHHLGSERRTRSVFIRNDDSQRVIVKLNFNNDKNARQFRINRIITTSNITCNDKFVSFKAESHNCFFLNQDSTVPAYSEWYLKWWRKQRQIAIEDIELQGRNAKNDEQVSVDGRNEEIRSVDAKNCELMSFDTENKRLLSTENKNQKLIYAITENQQMLSSDAETKQIISTDSESEEQVGVCTRNQESELMNEELTPSDKKNQELVCTNAGVLQCTYLDGRNKDMIFPGTRKQKLVFPALKSKELIITCNKNEELISTPMEEPDWLSDGDANGEQTVFDGEDLRIIPNDTKNHGPVFYDIERRDISSTDNKNQELISAENQSKILLSADAQIRVSPSTNDQELPLSGTESQEMIFAYTVFSHGTCQNHVVCTSDNDMKCGTNETILQLQTNNTEEATINNGYNQILASVEDMKSQANILTDYQTILGTTCDDSKSNTDDIDTKEACINHNGEAKNRTCSAVALTEMSDGTQNTNALNRLPFCNVDGDVLSMNLVCCDCQQITDVCQFERFDPVGLAKDVTMSDTSCEEREGDITGYCGYDQLRNNAGDKQSSHVDISVDLVISDTKGRSIIDNKMDVTNNTVITLATHDGTTLLLDELPTDAHNYIEKVTFNKSTVTWVTGDIVPTMPPDNRDVNDDTKEFSTDITTRGIDAGTKQSDFNTTGQLLTESDSGPILRNIFSNSNKTRPTDINISGESKSRKHMSNEKISIPGRGSVVVSNVREPVKSSPTKDIMSARNVLVRSDTAHRVHFSSPLAEYIEYDPGSASSLDDDDDDGDANYVFHHAYENNSYDEEYQDPWVDEEVDARNKFNTRGLHDQACAKKNTNTDKQEVKQSLKTLSTPREDASYLEKEQFVPVCLNVNSDQGEKDDTLEEDERVQVSQSKSQDISLNLSPNSHITKGLDSQISGRNIETEAEVPQSADESRLMVKQNTGYNDNSFCKQESEVLEEESMKQMYVTETQHLKAVKRKRCQLIDVNVHCSRKALKVQICNDGNAIVPTRASLPQPYNISAHYDSEDVDKEIPDDTLFYEQADMKGRPDVCSTKSFPWKYKHCCSNLNMSNDQGHSDINSGPTKPRPLRLGLSRKQKVASLHPYFKYKQGH